MVLDALVGGVLVMEAYSEEGDFEAIAAADQEICGVVVAPLERMDQVQVFRAKDWRADARGALAGTTRDRSTKSRSNQSRYEGYKQCRGGTDEQVQR